METISERRTQETTGTRTGGQMRRLAQILAILIPLAFAPRIMAQQARQTQPSAVPDLQGVYQSIPDSMTLPGGLKNAGSPAAIELLPEAARQAKSIDLRQDASKMCQPVGPFRMMAATETKIELVPVRSMIVMLFEDLSHGMMRTIYLKRGHKPKTEPTWLGDSVGRWEGNTLIVDTIGFNDQTWLNGEGAQHSDALHLVVGAVYDRPRCLGSDIVGGHRGCEQIDGSQTYQMSNVCCAMSDELVKTTH